MTLLVAVLVVITGCSGDDDAADTVTEGGVDAAADRQEAADADVDDSPAAEPDGEASSPSIGELAADTGRMLVREGTVTVRYPETFDAAFAEVGDIASDLGGAVTGVTSEGGDGGVTGSVTVEVPVEAYDRLLARITEVGEVLRREIRTEEVTEEHVDLSSRLRHLERQEEFYLELFEEAEGVEDALAIQRHLEQVQERKEQVQGRLEQLERMAATSTLRVELVAEGSEADLLEPRTAGFGAYWDDAVGAFVRVAGTILVLVVGSAPLALAGGVVLAVVLLAVRVWRGGAATP